MRWHRQAPPAATPPAITDPFAAVPIRPDDVELRQDSTGRIHLRRAQPLQGFARRVANWLHYDYTRKVELDEYGTLYYSLVDGRHTLRAIVDAMLERFPRDRREVEQGVILFTKKLMTMNLVALQVRAAPRLSNP